MRWRTGLAAGICLAGLAFPAAAQDAALTADLRCAVAAVSLAGASANNPTLQQQATMAALYFIGKLDGHSPHLDLEAGLRTELAKMSPQDMAAEGKRCGAQLMSRGQALQAIGEHFKAPPAVKP